MIGYVRAALVALSLALAGAPEAARAQLVQIDLRDADIRSFVEIVAEAIGRAYVLDPAVRGTVTVLTPDGITSDELYEVFLSVLELNRLTIVEGVGSDRIVPMASARELAPGTPLGIADGDYATQVIRVENAPLQEIIDVVRPLLPSEAVLSAIPGSKLLILSDRGQNQRRIEALVRRLDVPQEMPVDIVRLREADASEVLQVIQGTGIVPEGATVTVDARSNALVISAPASVVERVRLLAARLDTQRERTASAAIALNYADAAAIADIVLRSIEDTGPDGIARVRIIPEPTTNSLLVTAPEDRLADIHEIVSYLDRRPMQVLVEAVIFEMSVEAYADLSSQFGAILNSAVVGGAQFALEGRPTLTGLVTSVLAGEPLDPGTGGFIGGRVGNEDGVGFFGFLSAIARTQSTRLLSTPSIMTLNNQEAEIVVAQNVPFVTGSFATVGESAVPDQPFQTIERQDVGLTLKVVPQINADQTVKLDIEQEVSNLTRNAARSGGEITSRRALTTSVLVRDGNVVLLGGLLENGGGSTRERTPGLSRLPGVGALFRGADARTGQRVLLILLRPQVVASEAEATHVTQEVAREAKAASLAIAPTDDGQYPRAPDAALPYDGADLDQPFDAGFVDDLAERQDYPPLPTRLRFR